MVMLAEHYDYVIGGDPDRDTVHLAVVDTATGGVRAHLVDRADGAGYARMLAWAQQQAPGRRVWALEGIGSFAGGLAVFLAEAGEDVVEIGGVKRAAREERPHRRRSGRPHRAVQRAAGDSSRAGVAEALRMVWLPGKRFWSAARKRSTS
jgi:transposase